MKGVPSFQNFTNRSSLLLRRRSDAAGHTAVDKSSGEVIELDVTLNVIRK